MERTKEQLVERLLKMLREAQDLLSSPLDVSLMHTGELERAIRQADFLQRSLVLLPHGESGTKDHKHWIVRVLFRGGHKDRYGEGATAAQAAENAFGFVTERVLAKPVSLRTLRTDKLRQAAVQDVRGWIGFTRIVGSQPALYQEVPRD